MGPKLDLAGNARRDLLPLYASSRETNPRAQKSAEVDGPPLQRWLGRPNSEGILLRPLAQPDGLVTWPLTHPRISEIKNEPHFEYLHALDLRRERACAN